MRDNLGKKLGPDYGEVWIHLTSKRVILLYPQPLSHCNSPDRKRSREKLKIWNMLPSVIMVQSHWIAALTKRFTWILITQKIMILKGIHPPKFFCFSSLLKIELDHMAKAVQLTNGWFSIEMLFFIAEILPALL